MKSHRIAHLLSLLLLGALAFGCASGGGAPPVPAEPPAPAIPAAVGSWTFTIDTPAGTQNPAVTIAGTEGALTGTFGSPDGEVDMTTVSFADGTLEFSVTIDFGGQAITLNFSGTVDGDSVDGTFASDFGDFPGSGVRNTE